MHHRSLFFSFLLLSTLSIRAMQVSMVLPKQQQENADRDLFWSIRDNNYMGVVYNIYQYGANPNAEGGKLLLDAIPQGKIEIIKTLINAGYDVDTKCADYNGMTPLMYAAHCGRDDVFRLLLNKRAKIALHDNYGLSIKFYIQHAVHHKQKKFWKLLNQHKQKIAAQSKK